jgi:hypothetical protein
MCHLLLTYTEIIESPILVVLKTHTTVREIFRDRVRRLTQKAGDTDDPGSVAMTSDKDCVDSNGFSYTTRTRTPAVRTLVPGTSSEAVLNVTIAWRVALPDDAREVRFYPQDFITALDAFKNEELVQPRQQWYDDGDGSTFYRNIIDWTIMSSGRVRCKLNGNDAEGEVTYSMRVASKMRLDGGKDGKGDGPPGQSLFADVDEDSDLSGPWSLPWNPPKGSGHIGGSSSEGCRMIK